MLWEQTLELPHCKQINLDMAPRPHTTYIQINAELPTSYGIIEKFRAYVDSHLESVENSVWCVEVGVVPVIKCVIWQ